MDELQKYVESLFSHQKKNSETDDLKEEILSNMIAKKNDLVSQGFSENEAIQKVKESLLSIDELIEDNQLTDIQEYSLQCSYSILFNCVLFWIFSMPLLVMKYSLICFIGLIATVISGICYYMKLKNRSQNQIIAFISVSEKRNKRKKAWILWCLFYLVASLSIAIISFGSNIWFVRPIKITGPYAFANIIARSYVPLLSIFIPITIDNFTKLLIKCEKRYDNENEK